MMRRYLPLALSGPVLLVLMLGSTVRLADDGLAGRPGAEPWTIVLTTEDAPYAPDPCPIAVDPGSSTISGVTMHRIGP